MTKGLEFKWNRYYLKYVIGRDFYRNQSKTEFTIRDVFENYWTSFLTDFSHLNIRPIVFKEIDKVLKCRTGELGYTMYECPDCNNSFIVNHTCKSRFCSSCGNQYAKKRALNISKKCMKKKHRHITFSISDELWTFFLKERRLLNLLFESVDETMKYVFHHLNKLKQITPGYVLVMHTYGRDLKWNPHIHMLITEGGLTRNKVSWRNVKHFHYALLRKTFQRIVLEKLHQALGNPFYKLKCKLYKKYDSGFYVHAPDRQFKSIDDGVQYLVRYTGKPVMAESRILDLDLDHDTITYWYEDHKTGKRVEATEHVYEFIAKIIRHIPEENFKMVRYYGIYSAKNHMFRPYMDRMFTVQKIKEMKNNLAWRFSIISNFHIDPIQCECGAIMKKTYSYIPYGGSDYREIIYEKTKEGQIGKRAFGENWEHFTKYSPQN